MLRLKEDVMRSRKPRSLEPSSPPPKKFLRGLVTESVNLVCSLELMSNNLSKKFFSLRSRSVIVSSGLLGSRRARSSVFPGDSEPSTRGGIIVGVMRPCSALILKSLPERIAAASPPVLCIDVS